MGLAVGPLGVPVGAVAGTTNTAGGTGAASGVMLPGKELAELFPAAPWALAVGSRAVSRSMLASSTTDGHACRHWRRLAAELDLGLVYSAARPSSRFICVKMPKSARWDCERPGNE